MIAKVAWGATAPIDVATLPTPIVGEGQRQRLSVPLTAANRTFRVPHRLVARRRRGQIHVDQIREPGRPTALAGPLVLYIKDN